MQKKQRLKGSVKKFLELTTQEISKMTRGELAEKVSRVASAVNKRLARMEQAGRPVTEIYPKGSVKGKSKAELQSELERLKDIYNKDFLSLRGEKRRKKEFAKELHEKFEKSNRKNFRSQDIEDSLGERYAGRFWRLFDRATEVRYIEGELKYQLFDKIVEVIEEDKRLGVSRLWEKILPKLDELVEVYEKTFEDSEEEYVIL